MVDNDSDWMVEFLITHEWLINGEQILDCSG